MRKTKKKSALALIVVLSVLGVSFGNSNGEAANFGVGGVGKLFDDTAVTNATMVPSPTGTKPSGTLRFHGRDFYVVENKTESGNNYLTLLQADTLWEEDCQFSTSSTYGPNTDLETRQKAYGGSHLYTVLENLYSTKFASDSIIQEITLKEELPASGGGYESEVTLKDSSGNDLTAHIWAPSLKEIATWTGNATQRSTSEGFYLRTVSKDYNSGVYAADFYGGVSDIYAVYGSNQFRPAMQILNSGISYIFTSKSANFTDGVFADDAMTGDETKYRLDSSAVKPVLKNNVVILDGTKTFIDFTASSDSNYHFGTMGLLTSATSGTDTWANLNGTNANISYMAKVVQSSGKGELDLQNVTTGIDYALKIFGMDTRTNMATELADKGIKGLSKGDDGKVHLKIGNSYNTGMQVYLENGAVVDLAGNASNYIGVYDGTLNLDTYTYSGSLSLMSEGVLTIIGSNGTLNCLSMYIYDTYVLNIGNEDATNDKIISNINLGAVNIASDGTLEINANKLGGTIVNNGNLNLKTGTLEQVVTGTGNITYNGNVSTNADNIAVTGTNTVNVGKTLNFIGGTLTKNITGTGESKFSNTVAVANGVNLGTNTNTVNGTLEVPGNITASNINFKSGSILKVDGNNIQTTAAISGLTSAMVESGAKLYIANADKDIAYKILDGSGITADGWTESDIDFSKILTATYGLAFDKVDNDGTVFNVYFKEDVSATGGTVIANIVQARDGLLNDYITKLSDNNLGDTEKVSEGINALANMGENLNVTAGAVDMANMVGDSITEHWQNVPTQETAELRNTANDGENYIVDTVEQGKAKELMPVRVEENDGGKYVWASYIHNKNKVDGIKLGGMDGKYNAQYNGTIVGVDLTKNFGVALTYSEGNISNDFGGRNKAKYYGGSIYGRKVFGKVNLYGDITYTHAKNELQQNSVTADAKTDTVSVGLTAKYLAKACKTGNVAPFVGVRYIRIDGKEYTDSLGISREADKINSVVVPLGLEYSGEFVMPGSVWTWRPTVAVGFMFNFGDRDNDMTMKYNGVSDTFGYDFVDKHTFFTRVGMDFVKKNFTLGVGYNFMKSSSSRNDKWNVNLQYSFL